MKTETIEWFNVHDKLPELNGTKLVFRIRPTYHQLTIANFDSLGWYTEQHGHSRMDDVEFWAELPKGPLE